MVHTARGLVVLSLIVALPAGLQARPLGEVLYPASGFPVGSPMMSYVLPGDLDGDGRTDLVIWGQFETNVVRVLGDGRDGFGVPLVVNAGIMVESAGLGDIEADGDLDAVVVSSNGAGLVVALLNDGEGRLDVGPATAIPGSGSPLAVGDLDGDGRADVVVLNFFAADAELLSLLSDGAGQFTPHASTVVAGGAVPLALGDLDADGDLDVVGVKAGGAAAVRLLGDGTGGFGAPLLLGTQFATYNDSSLNLADMNGDGRLDIVIGDTVFRETAVLLGDGAGGLATEIKTDALTAEAVGDIDGDGRLDVAGNDNFNNVTLALGQGDGTLHPSWNLDMTGFVRACLVHLDGDDAADLVKVGEELIGVVPGRSLLDPAVAAAMEKSISQAGLAAGDLNGDGAPELVSCYPSGFGSLNVFVNDGHGGYPTNKTVTASVTVDLVQLDDVDNDGDLDALTFGVVDHGIHVHKGNGTATFASDATYTLFGEKPVCLGLGDLDGDGIGDAVAGRRYEDASVVVAKGLPNGAFDQLEDYSTAGDDVRSVVLGDLDEDGDLDVVAANRMSSSLAVLPGDGLGGLLPVTTYTAGVGQRPISLALSDLDEDGHVDVVSANTLSNTVSVLRGDGQGGLSVGVSSFVGLKPYAVATPEIDGDGHADLAVLCGQSSVATLLLGNGTGQFPRVNIVSMNTLKPLVAGWEQRIGFVTGDLNLDGRPDLAAHGSIGTGDVIHVRLQVGPAPWTDLGGPLAGGAGVPRLFGTGSLDAATPGALHVEPVAPSAVALLFVSLASSAQPFKGGVLQALPAQLIQPLGTGAGSIELPFTWPAGLPDGVEFVAQCAIADAGAPHGVALSNAVLGAAP